MHCVVDQQNLNLRIPASRDIIPLLYAGTQLYPSVDFIFAESPGWIMLRLVFEPQMSFLRWGPLRKCRIRATRLIKVESGQSADC
jgi:hypothetical protein